MLRKQVSKTKKPRTPRERFNFRRHVLPPLIGVAITGSVLLVLNLQWLSAQWRYRQHKPNPQQIGQQIAEATTPPAANEAPGLNIPSIGVKAPIVFTPRTDEGGVQLALRDGVVHYATTAKPGQNGNVVLFGHSSGQAWAKGNYKFVFTLLNKLTRNDIVTIGYDGKRYTYVVLDSKVVDPTDVSVLNPTGEPTLTLITCTPVGTSRNRLVVTARQIDPDPQTAPAQTTGTAPNINHLPN
jgi:sortase A